MPLDMFICVHSVPEPPGGLTIRAATEARCKPPWVLGSAHPATHAYVAWTHGDGIKYRLDAQPGGAKLSAFRGPARGPAAWWRIKLGSGSLEAGFNKAIDQIGVPYDFLELLPQMLGPLPGLNLPPPPPLPSFLGRLLGKQPKPVSLAFLDLVKPAVICTHLTTNVMQAMGGEVAETARQMGSRFPEELAQLLRVREGLDWIEPVAP